MDIRVARALCLGTCLSRVCLVRRSLSCLGCLFLTSRRTSMDIRVARTLCLGTCLSRLVWLSRSCLVWRSLSCLGGLFLTSKRTGMDIRVARALCLVEVRQRSSVCRDRGIG